MELTIAQRVQRGIALLDGLGPENWRSMIDLDMLDIASIDLTDEWVRVLSQ